MKKITILALLLVCALGYSQSNAKLSSKLSATMTGFQQQKQDNQIKKTKILAPSKTSLKGNGINNPKSFSQTSNQQRNSSSQSQGLRFLNGVIANQPVSLSSSQSQISTGREDNPIIISNSTDYILAPCDSNIVSNNFENGQGCSANNNWTSANDIVVTAGNDAMLNTIVPNIFMNPGATAASVDVTIWSDAGGVPGTAIDTQLGVVPTSQTVVGSNYGLDISAVTMDLTPVSLSGDVSSDTTYWVSIQVTPSDDDVAFWEMSTASSIGNPLAFNDSTGWTIPDTTFDGVYVYMVDCTPIGGGGSACDSNIVSNNFENGQGCSANNNWTSANDIVVTAGNDAMLNTIVPNIFMNPGATAASVDVTIWSDAGGVPGTAIDTQLGVVPTSQTVVGSNYGLDISAVTMDLTPVSLSGDVSSDTTYWVSIQVTPSDDDVAFWEMSTASSIGNPLAFNDSTGWTIPDTTFDGVYVYMVDCTPIGGGGSNDDCSGAIAVACGDSLTGETITATDSGGNAAPDVFYMFTGTGTPQIVTVSLCAATDYDSAIHIYDNCDLANELAFNDDFCGVQSEVSFQSDGTSTYYIMVEGYDTSSGNFSLDVTCEDPLPNDYCSGAIAVSCGDSITGTTIGATIDTGAPDCGDAITSPGVWYSLDDNSGLPGNITLSLCNGTDFDSKISVYTGDCAAPVCVGSNDDFCGLQSEITFASDGNTSYLILIHGYGSATGNFTLDVNCDPTPPPNDMIANSIDVDEIGFPYTDPAVAMPAATIENGNPVDCNLTGANGVWYNFVPVGDGTANASITTPSGASSVTFYTAPNENAVETDLTLVPQNGNQCAPGTSAHISTIAGQAYYVFVLNTGAVTDIVIDGTNLGLGDNSIEGFSYYPNPSSDVLNLRSVDNIENVSLYNMLGQRVLGSNANVTEMQLDISALSTGTYLMKVTVNGEIGTYKVIKN